MTRRSLFRQYLNAERWPLIRQLSGGAGGYWLIHTLVNRGGKPVCIDQVFLGILCVAGYMVIEALIRASINKR